MPVSDTRNLASGVRKVEFKLSHLLTSLLLPLLHILLMSRQTDSVAPRRSKMATAVALSRPGRRFWMYSRASLRADDADCDVKADPKRDMKRGFLISLVCLYSREPPTNACRRLWCLPMNTADSTQPVPCRRSG